VFPCSLSGLQGYFLRKIARGKALFLPELQLFRK